MKTCESDVNYRVDASDCFLGEKEKSFPYKISKPQNEKVIFFWIKSNIFPGK